MRAFGSFTTIDGLILDCELACGKLETIARTLGFHPTIARERFEFHHKKVLLLVGELQKKDKQIAYELSRVTFLPTR